MRNICLLAFLFLFSAGLVSVKGQYRLEVGKDYLYAELINPSRVKITNVFHRRYWLLGSYDKEHRISYEISADSLVLPERILVGKLSEIKLQTNDGIQPPPVAGRNYFKETFISEIGHIGDFTKLNKIVLPGTVEIIHSNAFDGCKNLSKVIIKPGNNVVIEDNAFLNCENIEEITIPKHCTKLSQSAFKGCLSLKNIYVEEGNPKYKSINGIVCSKDGKEVLIYPPGRDQMEVVLPEGITVVPSGVFSDMLSLMIVKLPSTIERIGDNAFENARNLMEINLPSGLKNIGFSAFASCSSLESISLPPGLQHISSRAFSNCSMLKEINIPGSVKSINEGTFEFCYEMRQATLGEGVEYVGRYAFYGCEALKDFRKPKSLKEIHKEAFNVVID